MLPIVLVLLVATSAFAAPSVNLSARSFNEVAPLPSNGNLVSAFLTDQIFGIVDGGDTNIYILTVENILNDVANQGDSSSQALALAQSVALLGSLAPGIPGDACAAATLIDAYTFAVSSRNFSGFRSVLYNYIQSLIANIDLIVQLANNPNAVRNLAGPRGNCKGAGRTYQFEAAWDSILAEATPNQASLINEEYCSAKRLYGAPTVRSNNAGAAVTAASLPPVRSIFQEALEPVARFLGSVASGNAGNANAAKQALSRAVANSRF